MRRIEMKKQKQWLKNSRIIPIMLVVLMVLFSLCGCNTSDVTSSETTTETKVEATTEITNETDTSTEESTDATNEDFDPIYDWIIAEDAETFSGHITFYTAFNASQGMQDIIDDFNVYYPNIEVELVTYANSEDGNLATNTALMAGEVDVIQSFGLDRTAYRWANNIFYDLTDWMDENNIDMAANWGSDAYQYDGRFYSIPAGGLNDYIVINMTEWENAGLGELPTSWTWDEYVAASEAMTHGEGDDMVYGGCGFHGAVEPYMFIGYQMYGENNFYGDDGYVRFNDSEFVDHLQLRVDCDGSCWYPLTLILSNNTQYQMLYAQGEVASSLCTNVTRFLRDTENYPVDFISGFAPYPTVEEGQENYMAGIQTFSHFAVNKESQNAECALEFLKFVTTYGAKYLVLAGHVPLWTGTDAMDLVNLLFGNEEDAAKIVDVESMLNVLWRSDLTAAVDTYYPAYSEVNNEFGEYCMYALDGTMTVEEAMAECVTNCNEFIDAALGN